MTKRTESKINQPIRPLMAQPEITRHFDRESTVLYTTTDYALTFDDYFKHNKLSTLNPHLKDVWVTRIRPQNIETGLELNTYPTKARMCLNDNAKGRTLNNKHYYDAYNYHLRLYGVSGKLLSKKYNLHDGSFNQLFMFSTTKENAIKQYNHMLGICFKLLTARSKAFHEKIQQSMIDMMEHHHE